MNPGQHHACLKQENQASATGTIPSAVNDIIQMGNLSPADPSSFSRPDIAVLTHMSLVWSVNFTEKALSGVAELNFDILLETAEIILDANNLNIERVKLEDGTLLKYALTQDIPTFGCKLTVTLPSRYLPHTKVKLIFTYKTSPGASALQWLDASQTSGKMHPFLFSECQPIHARSIVPCQDTPAVKFTYTARVEAPEELTVLMSAVRQPGGGGGASFSQRVPIPSYLLAIAVGDLESRTLGPRSTVWAERDLIERSAWEFADTDKYLQEAERLCGEYAWTEYNLLVLPPSFPYGGMENPCLTFVTPTLLAGDRSQANVIVHEIMHSWSGNRITNKNFEHFWLNEGLTVFLERKVLAALEGDAEKARRMRDFESLLGLQELTETITGHLGDANPLTRLVVDLCGVHPDDAFSRVPYEKGSLFLRYLEDLVGGPEVFDPFLRMYFQTFEDKSIDTDQFKDFFERFFRGNTRLAEVDWETWLHSPGMPPVIPHYDTTLAIDCHELVKRIRTEPIASLSVEDVANFSPKQIIHLMQKLLEQDPLPMEKLQAIGNLYKFNKSRNSEVIFRWLRLSIKSKDESIAPKVLEFLNSQGRMKYVRPLYREMYAWEAMRAQTIDNFLNQESSMMHVVSYMLKKDLHLVKE